MTVLEAIAERVTRGEELDGADARAVLGSHDLIAIGMMGDEVRRRMHGVRTTFVRVFEIHTDALPAALPAGASAGEFRIVGRPHTLANAVAAVRAVRDLAGRAPVSGYALADLAALATGGSTLLNIFSQLKDAGLDAVAEVSVDAADAPDDAIRAARQAGLMVARLTVESFAAADPASERGMPADVQIASIERARAMQTRLGGFRAFAPLPQTAPPTTGYDDVKQLALARLVAANIESIQVDWALYGPKLAQVGLTVGADDVDSVAAVDAGSLGLRRSPLEEIRRNIRTAGLEPVERDGLFRAS